MTASPFNNMNNIKDMTRGKPPKIRLIGAGPPRQGQGFGHGADGQPDDDLVGRLGHLAGAGAADMGDAAAEDFEHRPGALERRLRPPGHDGQRPRLRPHGAAGNGRVHVIAAGIGDPPGEFLGGGERRRPHVDDQAARAHSGDDAVRARDHRFHGGGIGNHDNHGLRRLGNGTGTVRRDRAVGAIRHRHRRRSPPRDTWNPRWPPDPHRRRQTT